MKYKLKHNLPHEPATCLGWLLDARGIEDIEGYVYPSKEYELSPNLLDNIDDAAKLLKKHLDANSKILFVVDSDCDGVCSSAMLWLYIKDFYPNANLNYICHEHKAHGLDDIIESVAESDYNLIILPDASSFDYVEHKTLHDLGKEILVLDHHDAPRYSEDAVVVNNQLSEKYTNKSLCGAGVVYKFLCYLDNKMGLNRATYYLDLCALANVADCMSPKSLETRYYITEGLKHINNGGFQALINAQSFSLFRYSQGLNYIKIAFYIAPLINAVVRIGSMDEKNMLFEAFIKPHEKVQSKKRGAKIGDMVDLADELARIAANARSRQNSTKEKAIDLIDYRIHKYDLLENKIIVVELEDSDKIPQELTGLLATQFVNKYGRPCMIVRENNEGYLRGSLRGNENFEEVPDFATFLRESGFMEYVEGHANAAGVSFKKHDLSKLLGYANTMISEEGLDNVYSVDYIFGPREDFSQIAIALGSQEDLWGNDISEPTAIAENISITKRDLFVMGANKDSVKFVKNNVEFVKFKDTDFIEELLSYPNCEITMYGRLGRNEFAGKVTGQFLIEDYEIRDTSDDF